MSTFRVRRIHAGNAGVLDTVDAIIELIREHRPRVRQQAERILIAADAVERDPETRTRALFQWVQDHLVYMLDMPGASAGEEVQDEIRTPEFLLDAIEHTGYAFGDCDDYVSLLGSFLWSIGQLFTIVVIATNPEREYDHVYLTVGGVPADASAEGPFGWEVPAEVVTARKNIPVR